MDQKTHFGVGGEEQNALTGAKRWAIILNIAAGLVSVAALFVTFAPVHIAALVSLALLPPLVIFLIRRFPLLFTVYKRKIDIDPRPDMGFVTFCPAVVLMAGGTAKTHLVEPVQLIPWFVLVLACYVPLFRVAWNKPSRWGAIIAVLITGVMYSVGLINAANTVPDRSIPQLYRTEILNMHESHGRHTSYYLLLASWGPLAQDVDVSVSKRLYEQVQVGDEVCVGLYPGFLHAPWYTLQGEFGTRQHYPLRFQRDPCSP